MGKSRPKITVRLVRRQTGTRPLWEWRCSGIGCKDRLGGHGVRSTHDLAVEDGLTHLRTRHLYAMTLGWAA